MAEVNIKITDLIPDGLCVASNDGLKVSAEIGEYLAQGKLVELSFTDVINLTSAFLNAAVGQLYGRFNHQLIDKNLTYTELAPEDRQLLETVISNAKKFFNAPERYTETVKRIMEVSEDE